MPTSSSKDRPTRRPRRRKDEPQTPRTYRPGRERKRELLAAALRIISRDGLAALTHRSVAAEAAIPSGSVTYYFPTRDALVEGAFHSLVDAMIERIQLASEAFDEAPDDLEAAAALAIDVGQRELRDRDAAGALAELEVIIGIARNPALAPHFKKFLDQFAKVIERGIEKGLDSDDSKRDARIVQAYLRGVQLEALSRPDRPRSPRTLRSDLVHLLRALRR